MTCEVWYCCEVDELLLVDENGSAVYKLEDGVLIGYVIPIEIDFEAMGWTYLGEL